jgi:hypothetical protein
LATEVTLLTFGLPREILKRDRSREGPHKLRRGAAVVFGREGSHAFDFRSSTRNIEVSSHEGGSARATPWCRSGVWHQCSHAFDFRSTARNLEVSWYEGEFARAMPWCRPPARASSHASVCSRPRSRPRSRPPFRPILKRAREGEFARATPWFRSCVRARRKSRF